MRELSVRLAKITDLDAIDEIYNHAVAERATADLTPMTADARREWFERHDERRRPILVAEDEGVVVGWASLSDYRAGREALRHTAEISYYVHRDHRRKGGASALIRACIDRCPALAIKTLFGILLDDNEDSVRLLERLGFERWGQMPDVADFDGHEVGHLYYGRRV